MRSDISRQNICMSVLTFFLTLPAAPISGISASRRQAAENALAVAVQTSTIYHFPKKAKRSIWVALFYPESLIIVHPAWSGPRSFFALLGGVGRCRKKTRHGWGMWQKVHPPITKQVHLSPSLHKNIWKLLLLIEINNFRLANCMKII